MNVKTRSAPKGTRRSPPDIELYRFGEFDIPGVGKRGVRVCLPPGAHSARKPLPLLFMWDGQNVFDDAPSFVGGWHLHEAVRRRAKSRRRAPVIVGLEHGGVDRVWELNPYAGEGRSRFPDLLSWVSEVLMPRLRSELPISSEAAQTIVGGSSLGGLASLAAHLERPEVFGGAWAMSPSLPIAGGRVFTHVQRLGRPWRSRIYMDAGGREARGMLVHYGARLEQHLYSHGWSRGEILYHTVKNGMHNERHWKARSPRAMRFFFG